MAKGISARERILEIAEEAVLQKGFGATSIDEIITAAEITKSGFFYHFKDKNELAKGLLERYEGQNNRLLNEVFGRADQLSDDPLQRLLIGLTLFAERMASLPQGHPGCIVAAMSYQDRLFDREVRQMVAKIVHDWTGYFRKRIEEVVELYPPREPVDADQLARMICCTIDGSIIMAKAMVDPRLLPEQMLMARNHIKLMFSPALGISRVTSVAA